MTYYTPRMLDEMELSRACGTATVQAYELARTTPVVVAVRNLGDLKRPLWAFDLEDEDRTVVVADLTGALLLSKGITWAAAVEHARAGHRTSPDGLGDASSCALCVGGPPAGMTAKTFTHPEYVAPPGPVEETDAA